MQALLSIFGIILQGRFVARGISLFLQSNLMMIVFYQVRDFSEQIVVESADRPPQGHYGHQNGANSLGNFKFIFDTQFIGHKKQIINDYRKNQDIKQKNLTSIRKCVINRVGCGKSRIS